MPYSQTLQTLTTAVLREINEWGNSSLGLVPDTGLDSPLKTTDQTITDYINDACWRFCEYFYVLMRPVSGIAISAGTTSISITEQTVTISGQTYYMRGVWTVLWTPTDVTQYTLNWCGWKFASTMIPNVGTDVPGQPVYWYNPDEDIATLVLSPVPSVNGTLAMTGSFFPPILAESDDALPWLQDNWARVIIDEVCIRLGRKGIDDPVLAAKLDSLAAEYNQIGLQVRSLQPKELITHGFLMDVPSEPSQGIPVGKSR